MIHKIQLLVGIVLLSCSGLFSQTVLEDSFIYDGLTRTYRIYIPDLYNEAEAVPLVLNLHGYSSNSFEQLFYADFTGIADTANFIIVIPDGTLDESFEQYWNSFGLTNVDDIGFLSALIDTMQAAYNIDANCIYSTGMSNGGFMSYTLACSLSDRIAAIASVTGSMIFGQQSACNAQHPTPVMQIHGTLDGTVPYEGTFGIEPIDDVVAFWVEYNNCSPTPSLTDVPNTSTTDNCTAEHYVYTDGDNESSVELYKIIGGGHSWPGAPVNINTTNMDFNASKEIWRFFSQYKLDLLSEVEEENLQSDAGFVLYPNPGNDVFTLIFNDASKKSISIINSSGQLVQQFECAFSQTSIELTDAGVYFITVSSGEHTYSEKVIRQ